MFDSVAEPSAAAIAAKTHRTARLQALARQVAGLDERRAAIQARMRELVINHHGRDDSHAREMKALETEREAIENRSGPMRVELRQLRAEYAIRVAAALDALRREQATRVLSALAALRGAAATLCEIEAAIAGAGGVEFDPLARLAANFAACIGPVEVAARATAT